MVPVCGCLFPVVRAACMAFMISPLINLDIMAVCRVRWLIFGSGSMIV
ncbi:MAG: hypothetical protein RL654_1052 [Pseudomonadota bacterium]|jgi:hypothetical protein